MVECSLCLCEVLGLIPDMRQRHREKGKILAASTGQLGGKPDGLPCLGRWHFLPVVIYLPSPQREGFFVYLFLF